jgi:hypothetical protein
MLRTLISLLIVVPTSAKTGNWFALHKDRDTELREQAAKVRWIYTRHWSQSCILHLQLADTRARCRLAALAQNISTLRSSPAASGAETRTVMPSASC